jgi:hypothetical protein
LERPLEMAEFDSEPGKCREGVDDLDEQLRERSRVEDKFDDLPDQLRAGMASYETRRRERGRGRRRR